MTVPHPDAAPPPSAGPTSRVSDFSLMVGTANGTGSQTANTTLLRAIFNMGVPVHGKNVFPSNIQGLPTWFHIRASAEGWIARQAPEIAVAFNPATLHQDAETIPPGGVLILNGDLAGAPQRDDVTTYAIPVKELMADVEATGKIKDYLANMTYLGVVSQLLGIPLDVVRTALEQQFGGRQKLVDANYPVVEKAWQWSEANLEKADPYRIERMDATHDLMLITGNDAAALGSVFGGVTFVSWYPITPSTSLVDAVKTHLSDLRVHDGKPDWSIIQAEDELAAIGMLIGAGWAGARAMTATSGPGISLMAEFTGLGYFAEVPAVIWDVQRVGPSTGLPTRTGQGDVSFAYTLGHGDGRHPVLFPSTAEEAFEFGWKAFDVAEQAQTPVFVLTDLDLGMNTWMSTRFDYPGEPMKRGKVLHGDDIPEGFGRYRDVDGDGIPYRTLPGDPNPEGAWFARGTGHDEDAKYSERADDWIANTTRLAKKFDTIRTLVPAPSIDQVDDAELGVICFGTTIHAIEEARAHLAKQDARFSLLRLRALPINDEVERFIEQHDRIAVIEMNRDAQVAGILRAELPQYAAKIASIAHLDGLPYTRDQIRAWLAPHLDPSLAYEGDPVARETA